MEDSPAALYSAPRIMAPMNTNAAQTITTWKGRAKAMVHASSAKQKLFCGAPPSGRFFAQVERALKHIALRAKLHAVPSGDKCFTAGACCGRSLFTAVQCTRVHRIWKKIRLRRGPCDLRRIGFYPKPPMIRENVRRIYQILLAESEEPANSSHTKPGVGLSRVQGGTPARPPHSCLAGRTPPLSPASSAPTRRQSRQTETWTRSSTARSSLGPA
jgi:hypothetical protein